MKKLLALLTSLGLTFGLAVFPLTGTTLIINSFRFAPGIPHVADSNARLSLTAEGVVVSGGTTCDGLYTQRAITNDKPSYNLSSKPTTTSASAIYWVAGTWKLVDGSSQDYSSSSEDVPLPSDVDDWSDPGHGNPTPVVTHSPGQVTGAGYQVTQDDESNLIVHTFNGDGADADAGLRVTGAGTTSWIQAYVLNGGRYEPIPDIGFNRIEDAGGGAWTMGTDYAISLPDTYPWLQTWAIVAGDSPAPTVLRNPVASLANWTP